MAFGGYESRAGRTEPGEDNERVQAAKAEKALPRDGASRRGSGRSPCRRRNDPPQQADLDCGDDELRAAASHPQRRCCGRKRRRSAHRPHERPPGRSRRARYNVRPRAARGRGSDSAARGSSAGRIAGARCDTNPAGSVCRSRGGRAPRNAGTGAAQLATSQLATLGPRRTGTVSLERPEQRHASRGRTYSCCEKLRGSQRGAVGSSARLR